MSAVKQVTEQSFPQEVEQSPVPVLVDFYAEWCGPCRKLAPTLERLSEEFEGRAKVVKVNVDQESGLAVDPAGTTLPGHCFVRKGIGIVGHWC